MTNYDLELHDRRQTISVRVVLGLFLMALGIAFAMFAAAADYGGHDRWLVMGLAALAIIPGFPGLGLIFTSMYLLWDIRGLEMVEEEKEEEAPEREPSGMVMKYATRPAVVHLEPHRAQTKICKYPLEPPHWLQLLKTLRKNHYKWVKPVLVSAQVFRTGIAGISITASGHDGTTAWQEICAEFERMEWIKGGMNNWQMTEFGKEHLHDLAGIPIMTGPGH